MEFNVVRFNRKKFYIQMDGWGPFLVLVLFIVEQIRSILFEMSDRKLMGGSWSEYHQIITQ